MCESGRRPLGDKVNEGRGDEDGGSGVGLTEEEWEKSL